MDHIKEHLSKNLFVNTKRKTLPFKIKVKIYDKTETQDENKRLYVSLIDLEEEDLRLIYKHVL